MKYLIKILKYIGIVVLVTAVIGIAAVVIAPNDARADYHNTLYARWGCPTADGPIDIARAWELDVAGTITPIALAHDCIVFPMPMPIEPVRFVKGVNADGGKTAFVWEFRLVVVGGNKTFFSNFDAPSHATFMHLLSSL